MDAPPQPGSARGVCRRMKRYLLPLLVTSFYVSAPVFAQEPTPGSTEPEGLKEKAAQEKEEKRLDQAEARERKKNDAFDGKYPPGERQMERLHRAGKHDEAERLQRKVAGSGGRKDRGSNSRSHRAGPQRVRHAMQAIRHLHAAGLHDQAKQVEETARRLREEIEEQQRIAGARGESGAGAREEQERHQAANRELHAQVKRMQNQIQKMAQQIESLHGAMKRQHEEAEGKP